MEHIEYFLSLSDADIQEAYRATLAKYRGLAREHGVPDSHPVCYQVRAGFTLKRHAPKAGPCRDGFSYLQGWNFPDEPTTEWLVFWVPRLLSGSTSKTVAQQIKLLADLRTRIGLPSHHLTGFGQVGLVAGLILAHFKAIEERVPLQQFHVRTDTCLSHGVRLALGGFAAHLGCSHWTTDDDAFTYIGAFPVGVELIKK